MKIYPKTNTDPIKEAKKKASARESTRKWQEKNKEKLKAYRADYYRRKKSEKYAALVNKTVF